MFSFLSKLYFLQNLLGRIVAQIIPPFLIHNLGKYFALKKAFYLVNLEELDGAYVEFGVFTGSSMACAIMNSRYSRVGEIKQRRFVGFDSFEGFGEISEIDKHPFYKNLNFKTNYESVHKRLSKVMGKNKAELELVKGYFSETCDGVDPSQYGIKKTAVVLIDCDTHDGAKSSFDFLEPTFQEGTILILDDFFSYKGSSQKGLKKAFDDWREKSEFKTRAISDYGMGGRMFILYKA